MEQLAHIFIEGLREDDFTISYFNRCPIVDSIDYVEVVVRSYYTVSMHNPISNGVE